MMGFIRWLSAVIGFSFLLLIIGIIFPFLWILLPIMPFVIIFYPVFKLLMPGFMKKKGF